MFERYEERARRVIFFARYEAAVFGSPAIESEHLLLGVLREDGALAKRLMLSSNSVEAIRTRIQNLAPPREQLPASVDLPLSHECKRVLVYAAHEAELNHRQIGTVHLLLGLLREEKCLAANLLQERGLKISEVRQKLAIDDSGSSHSPGSLVLSKLLAYLQSLPNALSVLATGWGIDVRADPRPGTCAFLHIELLSATVRFIELRRRVDEHFAMGARYFWLIDPDTRHVYIATPAAGLCEIRGCVLRTENPALELPLSEIFV